jgi:hypothetical protein
MDNVFFKARDEMHERGFSEGDLVDDCGRVCALGALGFAAGHNMHVYDYAHFESDGDLAKETAFLAGVINEHGYETGPFVERDKPLQIVYAFNDNNDQATVEQAFEKAAAKWDEQV